MLEIMNELEIKEGNVRIATTTRLLFCGHRLEAKIGDWRDDDGEK